MLQFDIAYFLFLDQLNRFLQLFISDFDGSFKLFLCIFSNDVLVFMVFILLLVLFEFNAKSFYFFLVELRVVV